MKSHGTSAFWKGHDRLPAPIRDAAYKQFMLWLENPQHPSLRFKRLQGMSLWSVRVTDDYRAVGYFETPDEFIWIFIGAHHEYDQLLRRR